MSKPTEDIIGAAEVARMLGIKVHGVYEGAARGQIPSWRIGKRVLFSRRAILARLHGEPTAPVEQH